MHEICAYDYIMANLHLSMENTDDGNPIHAQSEPFPDPASPENFSASDQVLINAAKQSKSITNLADIWHVLSNKSKPSANSAPKSSKEIVINGKTY